MEEQVEQCRQDSLSLCDRLLWEIKRNQDDTDRFFGGELYKTYFSVNDKLAERIRNVKNKIRNL